MNVDLTAAGGGTLVRVKAHAGARQNAVRGVHAGAVKVDVTAAPERGRANEAILRLLAKVLAVPRKGVELVSGERSTLKNVLVRPLEMEEIRLRLAQELEEGA